MGRLRRFIKIEWMNCFSNRGRSVVKFCYRDWNSVVEKEHVKLSDATGTSDSISSEQLPIATFDEWTKEKLKKEEERKAQQQVDFQYA